LGASTGYNTERFFRLVVIERQCHQATFLYWPGRGSEGPFCQSLYSWHPALRLTPSPGAVFLPVLGLGPHCSLCWECPSEGKWHWPLRLQSDGREVNPVFAASHRCGRCWNNTLHLYTWVFCGNPLWAPLV
jgi:hypothetical protein